MFPIFCCDFRRFNVNSRANYFKNKLDLLLSIVLDFWQMLNERIEIEIKGIQDPGLKLYTILSVLKELLLQDDQSIYRFKVVHEALPHIYFIREDALVEKRQEIRRENRKLNIWSAQ